MDTSLSIGRPAEGVLVELVGDDIVLYGPRTEQFYTLNHTAAAVWRMADGHHSLEQVAAEIAAEYDMSSIEIIDDVSGIVEEFRNAGLLRGDAA